MDTSTFERVLKLSRQMAETRALRPLLDYAMDEAMSLVGATRGYIVLLNADGSLDFRVKRSSEGSTKSIHEDQISKSILREVVTTSQPLIVADALADRRWSRSKSVVGLGIRSVMCVPLLTQGQTIGAIYLENRDRDNCFHDEDLQTLTLFANHAAVSIENAALNDDLEARVMARTADLEAARKQLEEGWREAVELNRKQTVLFGNVAHDVRAPLSVIISSMRLMLEGAFGDLTASQVDWITKSVEAAGLIQNLMSDVFDLTKIDQGQLRLHPEQTQLSEFMARIYHIGEGLPWADGVRLELDIAPELQSVMLDSHRIAQVLINLLSNALKFTKTGSVTLYARGITDEDAVLIGVRDTGEGIPVELQDKLFQRFQQVDQNQARRRTGTGLGLAICRELVEMHGGRIWVESVPDAGSDFKFILPLTISQLAEEKLAEP